MQAFRVYMAFRALIASFASRRDGTAVLLFSRSCALKYMYIFFGALHIGQLELK